MSDLLEMILGFGGTQGDRPAVIQAGDGTETTLSWWDLRRLAASARSAATLRGIAGPAALLLRGNEPLAVPLLFGLAGHHGVLPVNPMLPARSCAALLSASGVSEVIFDDRDMILQNMGPEVVRMADRPLKAIPLSEAFNGTHEPQASASGDRLLLHTSGSTGIPRIALHDTGRLMGLMEEWSPSLFPERPRLLSMPPLFTAAGLLGGVLFCARLGGTLILPGGDGPAGPNFRSGLPALLEAHQPNLLFSVPPVLRALLPLTGRLVHRFDALLSGGMLMPDQVGSEISKGFNAPLHHVYASSEMSIMATTTYLPNGGIVGMTRPDTGRLRIINPDTGQPCGDDEGGEIHVSSPLIPASGPYLDPRAEDMSPYGFRTGDFGRLDESGRLVLTGRMSDLVKYNGRRVPIGPMEELVSELTSLPCAAVQGPDPETGESVTLFVEGEPPGDLAEMIRKRIPDPAYAPRRVIALTQIPRAGLGKPDRSSLSRMARTRIAEELLESAGIAAPVSVSGTLRDGFRLTVITGAEPDLVSAALRGIFDEVRVGPDPEPS